MTTRRLYLPHAAPGRRDLDAQTQHYLRNVLRLSAGATLDIFDGTGGLFSGRILEDGTIKIEPDQSGRGLARSSLEVTLWQGLPRGEKFDLILQKATELGVSRIVPVACERSVVRLDAVRGETRVARWRRVAQEAARQCERADVPEIEAPMSLTEAMTRSPRENEARLVFDPRATLPLSAFASAARFTLLVGPEGGLSLEELSATQNVKFVPVTLGPRILRTETVALAALAILAHLRGELG